MKFCKKLQVFLSGEQLQTTHRTTLVYVNCSECYGNDVYHDKCRYGCNQYVPLIVSLPTRKIQTIERGAFFKVTTTPPIEETPSGKIPWVRQAIKTATTTTAKKVKVPWVWKKQVYHLADAPVQPIAPKNIKPVITRAVKQSIITKDIKDMNSLKDILTRQALIIESLRRHRTDMNEMKKLLVIFMVGLTALVVVLAIGAFCVKSTQNKNKTKLSKQNGSYTLKPLEFHVM